MNDSAGLGSMKTSDKGAQKQGYLEYNDSSRSSGAGDELLL